MTTPFVHTTRSIRADGAAGQAGITAVGLVFLLAWATWLFRAEITVYQSSDSAALRQSRNTVALSAPRAGRITAIHTAIGDPVREGESLLQLDATSLALDISGEAELQQKLARQLNAVDTEKSLLENRFHRDTEALRQQLALLRRKQALQQGNLEIQTDITSRYERLLAKQQTSQLDYLVARRNQQQIKMDKLQAEADVKATENRLDTLESDYRRALAELDRRRSDIEQRRVQANTRLQQRTLAAEEFRLRAPIAGSLSSLADLSVGQLLRAGQSIGSIQAQGPVRVEARFEPAALGHIKPGQKARVRLDGFVWTDYGALDARVERVAAAVQGSRVLVQLAIEGEAPPGLPLLHDLPAAVEIATGHKTPWQLLLRRAGGWPGAARERPTAGDTP